MTTPAQMAERLMRIIEEDIPEDVLRASQLAAAYQRQEDRVLMQLELDDEDIAKRLSAYRARIGY